MNEPSSRATFRKRAAVAAGVILLGLLAGEVPTAANQEPPEEQVLELDFLRNRLPLVQSETGIKILSETLGVKALMGKGLDDDDDDTETHSAFPSANVGIGVDPTVHENGPTIAANPRRRKRLVAGGQFFDPPPSQAGYRCAAYTSANGGVTWSAPFVMPQLAASSQCSNPVLRYSPDGRRVYYVYIDIRPSYFTGLIQTLPGWDIVLSYSDDDGATWTGPILVLDGADSVFDTSTSPATVLTLGFTYDKPWIATHLPAGDDEEDDDNNGGYQNTKYAYVTAARFDDTPPFNCHITFTRSRNKGTSWASPVGLESSAGGCGTGASQVVHGARVSAGLGRNVVVAWYNSGPDGWLAGNFSIQTRASGNRGITWAPTVNAVTDSFEAPFRLGPNATYQPWWGTMFPDVEIDEKGRAHIVYTHDPEQGGTTAEEGDIRYIRSTNSAYSTWSAPITLNDDESGKAQGWPAMEVKATDRGRVVHVVWEDHRLSAPDNLLYDIFYAQRERGEWSANSRITTATSMSDSSVFGDNFDLTLIGSRGRNDGECVYAIWTDRRHQASILALEDNVFGARICH